MQAYPTTRLIAKPSPVERKASLGLTTANAVHYGGGQNPAVHAQDCVSERTLYHNMGQLKIAAQTTYNSPEIAFWLQKLVNRKSRALTIINYSRIHGKTKN